MAFQALCFEKLQTPRETPKGDVSLDNGIKCISGLIQAAFLMPKFCLSRHNPLFLIFLTVSGLNIPLT